MRTPPGWLAPNPPPDPALKKAFAPLTAPHVTTISAAARLFQPGTAPVTGFAVTLVLGLLA